MPREAVQIEAWGTIESALRTLPARLLQWRQFLSARLEVEHAVRWRYAMFNVLVVRESVMVAMVVEATEEVRVGSAAAAEGAGAAKAEATVAGAMVWRRRCGGGGDAGEGLGLG